MKLDELGDNEANTPMCPTAASERSANTVYQQLDFINNDLVVSGLEFINDLSSDPDFDLNGIIGGFLQEITLDKTVFEIDDRGYVIEVLNVAISGIDTIKNLLLTGTASDQLNVDVLLATPIDLKVDFKVKLYDNNTVKYQQNNQDLYNELDINLGITSIQALVDLMLLIDETKVLNLQVGQLSFTGCLLAVVQDMNLLTLASTIDKIKVEWS
jgi:hypothetical protein